MAERRRGRPDAGAGAVDAGGAATETNPHLPDASKEEADQHFVIFQLANGSFALRLDTVCEILRVPALARMPLAPSSLRGLANLRGAVLPVVSLRALLDLPDAPFDSGTRVIVVDSDARVGFVVDRVDRLAQMPASRVGTDLAGASGVDPGLLDGVIMSAEGESTTRILSPMRVLREQFAPLGTSRPEAAINKPAVAAVPTKAKVESDQISLISFELGRQEYAVPLERVREIIPLPDHAREIARSEAAVLGLVTLRDRLLPLVSLRALLGLQNEEAQQGGRVVVVSIGNSAVGIVADRTREILRVATELIDPAPALLTRGTGEAEITSICRLDGGRRLVALLSPDQLFRADVVRRVLASATDDTEANDKAGSDTVIEEQLIVFRLGDQEFGLPIEVIDEIARPPERVTPVPRAPAFIDGVINLRGSVIPIIDLRRRFELPASEYRRSRRILVMALGGRKTGFMVDGVSEIIKVPAGMICPAPQVSAERTRLIARVANLEAEGRLILLVDPAQLLDRLEADMLAQFDRSGLAHVPADS